MAKAVDLTGQRFGRLLVLARDYSKRKSAYWECLCDCGNKISTASTCLKLGYTKSCGCLLKEKNTKHNKSNSPEYEIWKVMLNRCFNSNNQLYSHYGGSGITVCKRWWDFENFYNDMGNKLKGESIDRIENYGDYEPLNCRWASPQEQQRNKTPKGYTWDKCMKKWRAQIEVDKKRITLGYYSSEIEAHNAYLEAKKTYLPPGDLRPQCVRRIHDCWDRLEATGVL